MTVGAALALLAGDGEGAAAVGVGGPWRAAWISVTSSSSAKMPVMVAYTTPRGFWNGPRLRGAVRLRRLLG
ncbi:MAG: hypothetical protein ACRDHX_02490 [Chloroflexota bacterium]